MRINAHYFASVEGPFNNTPLRHAHVLKIRCLILDGDCYLRLTQTAKIFIVKSISETYHTPIASIFLEHNFHGFKVLPFNYKN